MNLPSASLLLAAGLLASPALAEVAGSLRGSPRAGPAAEDSVELEDYTEAEYVELDYAEAEDYAAEEDYRAAVVLLGRADDEADAEAAASEAGEEGGRGGGGEVPVSSAPVFTRRAPARIAEGERASGRASAAIALVKGELAPATKTKRGLVGGAPKNSKKQGGPPENNKKQDGLVKKGAPKKNQKRGASKR